MAKTGLPHRSECFFNPPKGSGCRQAPENLWPFSFVSISVHSCSQRNTDGLAKLNSFEVPRFLPIRDRLVEGFCFETGVVDIKIDHIGSECFFCDWRTAKELSCFRQGGWQPRQSGINVSVSGIFGAAIEVFLNSS